MITAFDKLMDYRETAMAMENHGRLIKYHGAQDAIWLLSHHGVYTHGSLTCSKDITMALKTNVPVVPTTRGGKMTFHGPGQRMVYVMLDLAKRGINIHEYIFLLEQWIINFLHTFAMVGVRHGSHAGIWMGDKKIASLGIHVSSGITSHGMAINVTGDLSPFNNISPCGLLANVMTSMEQELGVKVNFNAIDKELTRLCPFPR